MQSVFQTKKKEPLMSVNPRMSVAPKQSTNSYSSTNPLMSLNQSKNTQQSTFRSSAPTQSVFQPKSVTSAPQSKVILGSGMTTNYSSNPTNYKPAVPTPAPKPVAKPVAPSPHEAYMTATEKLASQQKDFVTKQQAQREGSVKSKYQTLKDMISGQQPVAESNFNSFKADSEADIADLKATGERQKGQAEDYYGDVQRDAAKSLRETQGRDQRMFANLGTLDSRGEGSFQQATENSTSDFNRFTQQTLKAKADKFAEIDSTVSAAERQAQAAIRQEAAKVEDLKKQIQFALINNDQAMADELSGIAQEAEQNIMAIQEAVTGLKYQADLEKYKLDLENQPRGLSAGFMQTGNPESEADFIYRTQNPSAFGKLGAPTQKPTEKSQLFGLASQSAQEALGLLNSGVANSGKGQVLGSAFGRTFGNSSATQVDYESKLAAARGVALNALSGANVPESEYKRISALIPVLSDEPQIAKQKLQSFVEIMNMYGANTQATQGDELSQEQIQSILQNL